MGYKEPTGQSKGAKSMAKDPSAALAKRGKGGGAFKSIPKARSKGGTAAGGVPAGAPASAKGSTGGRFGKAGPSQKVVSKGGRLKA